MGTPKDTSCGGFCDLGGPGHCAANPGRFKGGGWVYRYPTVGAAPTAPLLSPRFGGAASSRHNAAVSSKPMGCAMQVVKVSDGGRVVIPADLRQKHGIAVGDDVFWRESADGLTLCSKRAAVQRIQAIAARYKKPGHSVVDELIQERRQDAAST
jgi:bifunctional DNA-binding transcriptional regulator/antitoxin component of YhaV-PrlF toxin-antitoxin module